MLGNMAKGGQYIAVNFIISLFLCPFPHFRPNIATLNQLYEF